VTVTLSTFVNFSGHTFLPVISQVTPKVTFYCHCHTRHNLYRESHTLHFALTVSSTTSHILIMVKTCRMATDGAVTIPPHPQRQQGKSNTPSSDATKPLPASMSSEIIAWECGACTNKDITRRDCVICQTKRPVCGRTACPLSLDNHRNMC
jgi:hypothetical protein